MAATITLAATSAWGEDVHLTYRGPDTCPAERVFKMRVGTRTDKARWVDAKRALRGFEITLRDDGSTATGQLIIISPDVENGASRDVAGETCDEVVRALALITALAIDPDASLVPRSTAPKPAPVPAPPKPPPAPPAPLPPPPPPPPAPVDDRAWRWTFGGGMMGTTGLGDKLAVVIPLFVDATFDGTSWFSPSFRLGATLLPDRVLTHPAARAHLSRYAGWANSCPVRVRFGKLALRPCVGVEVGALLARGDGIDEPATAKHPWVAATAEGRAQVFPWEWLLLEARLELGVSVLRHRFIVESATTGPSEIGRSGLFFGSFGGSLGTRIP